MQETHSAAEQIWDWLPRRDSLQPADILLVLGSSPTEAPEWSANLWHRKLAPVIVASGGFGRISGDNQLPEADLCAQILAKEGVPATVILIENKSTNTGENIAFSKTVLEANGLHVSKGIIVTTPLLTRRQKASLDKQWLGIEWQVTAPDSHTVEELVATQGDEFLHLIVGELDRLEEYPKKGYAEAIEIPDEIIMAKNCLIDAGYIKHILPR